MGGGMTRRREAAEGRSDAARLCPRRARTTHPPSGAGARPAVILSGSEESFKGEAVVRAVHFVTALPPLRDPSLPLRMTGGRGG